MTPKIEHAKKTLENHPLLITDMLQSRDDLKIFMEHHVYAVWDFMSLAKALQHRICPSGDIWLPSQKQRRLGRFINSIILAEESDIGPLGLNTSHFDLYCQAMTELGADTDPIYQFLSYVEQWGIDRALERANIPEPSRNFMTTTFDIIKGNKVHEIAGAFTFGRETVIPSMFRRLVYQLNINRIESSRLHYYLDRHIQVDNDDHGPAALQLITDLCEHHPVKIIEMESAAIKAIDARIEFWNEVKRSILHAE